MERQVHHLSRLIEDLLDISRIDQGKISLKKETVALQTIVEFAAEASRPQIEGKHHALTLDVPAGPTWLDADPTRLSQVVSNLLDNAAKYTPAGGEIRLAVRAAGGFVEIDVSDNGIGIAHDVQPKVFELFAQAASPGSKAHEGLGIGLALVKQLVELHGGTISVTSEGLNRGSTFRVRLPVAG
jgi:signal transduction histidine kinase